MKKVIILGLVLLALMPVVAGQEDKDIKGEVGLNSWIPITGSFKGIHYWNNIIGGKVTYLFITFDIWLILHDGLVVGGAYFNSKWANVVGTYQTNGDTISIEWKCLMLEGWGIFQR